VGNAGGSSGMTDLELGNSAAMAATSAEQRFLPGLATLHQTNALTFRFWAIIKQAKYQW